MSTDKQNTENKVYVKLRDKGVIFHDASQEQTITGTAVVAFKKTPKVRSAIKNGLLIETDAPKQVEAKKDATPADTGKADTNYSTWKKDRLKEELAHRKVEFDPEATNAQLAELLTKNDEATEGDEK